MSWSPEVALLLEATAPKPEASAISRIQQLIGPGLDWSELLRIAIPHGVLPLLSRNLSTFASSVAPPITLAQLQLHSKQVGERNREQSSELARIILALSREGIRVLPFKGPALAVTAYGDIGLRESHDLDFWVDPSQIALANEWFRQAGYHLIKHVKGVPREIAGPREAVGEFLNPDRRVLIEVRSHLERTEDSDFDPPFQEVWDRRGRIGLEGLEIPVLCSEDLILGLAVHGSKHLWRRLNWIADIAGVIFSHPEIEWEDMLRRSVEWRCRRRLLIALTLASSLYHVELPALFVKAAREQAIGSAVVRISARLFAGECRTIGSVTSDVFYRLQSQDSTRARLTWGRHWLGRVAQMDETQLLPPISKNLLRVCRSIGAVRRCLGYSKSSSAKEA